MTERPRCFKVGREPFYIYPITLGMLEVIKPMMQDLSHNEDVAKESELLELMRIVSEDREKVLDLIAYRTCRTYEEVCDMLLVAKKKKKLATLTDEQLTEILVYVLNEALCDTSAYEKELGITQEREWMRKCIACKKERKGNYQFNGLTIYGSFIGHFCKEYGWTYQYVLWGISYLNLKMLLADEPTEVYLSEDESKRCTVPVDRKTVIDLSSKEAANKYLHIFD